MPFKSTILLAVTLLSGCALCTPRGMVAVPVTITPKITLPHKPILATMQLSNSAKPMDIQKSQIKDLDAVMVYSDQLRKMLEELQ